jgi:ABC-type Fe3+-siderophore transport system permease subunit
MGSRSRQRIAGGGVALVGAFLTGWSWYTALTRGCFYRRAGLFFPAAFVLGVGLILLPGYREERLARGEDISGLLGWRLITVRWWAVIVVALVAAVANYALLSSR